MNPHAVARDRLPADARLSLVGHPPRDAQAERAVLSAMMLGPKAISEARAALSVADFLAAEHRAVFAAILALLDRGEPADLVTVTAELRRRGVLGAVGGPAFVASLVESATTAANVVAHAAIVREASARRKLRALAIEMLRRVADPTQETAAIVAHCREASAGLADSGGRANRFCKAAAIAPDLVARDVPQPRALLGDGVLAAGGQAVIYGRPGSAKSWLSMQLALALARGEPWLGLATPPAGARVGIIQLELGSFRLRERLIALGVGQHERDGNLLLVPRDGLRRPVDLSRPEDVSELAEFVSEQRIEVLIVDALSRAHRADENDTQAMGELLAGFDGLRIGTGVAPILVHHERKSREGARDDLDALRGSSRLQSDSTLLMRVVRDRGHRTIHFVKSSEAAEPPPIHFELDKSGVPFVVEATGPAPNPARERVRECVASAGRPVTRGEVQAALELPTSTTKKLLHELVVAGLIEQRGSNRDTTYREAPANRLQPVKERNLAGASACNAMEIPS